MYYLYIYYINDLFEQFYDQLEFLIQIFGEQFMCRLVFTFIFTGWMMLGLNLTSPALAADVDKFSVILEKMDKLVCTNPEQVSQYYSPELVIMIDDKRALLKNRIKDYRQMMSELVEMKCRMKRKVLASNKGDRVGYILADEQISVTAENVHIDERQHSVCSYMFSKYMLLGVIWKRFENIY